MTAETLRIQWAPKVRQARIRQLYQNDALGLVDEDLIAEVGFDLWQRCESILMVTDGNRVACPRCHADVVCAEGRWSREQPIVCPACSWQATYGQYRDSWRKRDLKGGNAVKFFRAYVAAYPQARTPQERMLLIDRLIHTFHWSARHQRNHAPVAVQLIEGGLEDVIAFLDRLSFGERASSQIQATHAEWQRTLDQVAASFAFVREKLHNRDDS